MRTRSTSPLQYYPQQGQNQQKKYYTRQQVSQILRAMIESKLSKIYQQLQEKQQLIRSLNDKLNRNDHLIQSSTKQMYQLSDQCSQASNIQMENTVELIHKMMHEKLQTYWHTVQAQLDKIRTQCQYGINKFHHNLQERASKILSQIKRTCQDNVQSFKKKNNSYWIKVKEALNKLNTKAVQSEEKMGVIGLQISKYETERQQNIKTIKQIQNGQNTAKMLVQLKKSVNNVYKNFEQVMKLQKTVKENYQKMGSIQKWNCDKCSNPESNSKNSWNFTRNNNKVQNKQQDIVILQYSVEEDTLSNHQIQKNQQKYQFSSKAFIDKGSKSIPVIGASKSNRGQFSNSNNNSNGEVFPLSPITGKIIQNSSMGMTQVLLGSDRAKNTHQTALTNASMKNQTLQWDHQQYLNGNNFVSQHKNDHSGSFQLVGSQGYFVSSNGNSRLMMGNSSNPATSTSMLNFSLECRKQMLESVRPRLIDMIETKGLSKPIKVYMDQINYLKNEDGNYLFDLKGNMFKLTTTQFSQLERDRIIYNIKANQQSKKYKKA